MDSPTADILRAARLEANLTQRQAADLLEVSYRAWQAWEQGQNPMPPGYWKLFLILTDPKVQPCLKEWGEPSR